MVEQRECGCLGLRRKKEGKTVKIMTDSGNGGHLGFHKVGFFAFKILRKVG